jgi:hypothetical protein
MVGAWATSVESLSERAHYVQDAVSAYCQVNGKSGQMLQSTGAIRPISSAQKARKHSREEWRVTRDKVLETLDIGAINAALTQFRSVILWDDGKLWWVNRCKPFMCTHAPTHNYNNAREYFRLDVKFRSKCICTTCIHVPCHTVG